MSAELQSNCLAETLMGAIGPLFPDAVFPQVYTGPLVRYVVWNYDVLPRVWAEGIPHAARYLVMVHYYLPHGEDPRGAILGLQRALSNAGFTWPSLTDATDSDGQHWVLECDVSKCPGFFRQLPQNLEAFTLRTEDKP